MKFSKFVVVTTLVAGISASGSVLAGPEPKSMSLNPYGSMLDNGAYFIWHQSLAPIGLPQGRPAFAQAFTVPQDYESGPLIVRLLVESDARGCAFDLRPDFLFHMSEGEISPVGTDFFGLDASVSYNTDGQGVAFLAPAPNIAVEVRFQIEEFARPIEAGDAITFGIFRAADPNDNPDNCEEELRVGGISIVYGLREERKITTR